MSSSPLLGFLFHGGRGQLLHKGGGREAVLPLERGGNATCQPGRQGRRTSVAFSTATAARPRFPGLHVAVRLLWMGRLCWGQRQADHHHVTCSAMWSCSLAPLTTAILCTSRPTMPGSLVPGRLFILALDPASAAGAAAAATAPRCLWCVASVRKWGSPLSCENTSDSQRCR